MEEFQFHDCIYESEGAKLQAFNCTWKTARVVVKQYRCINYAEIDSLLKAALKQTKANMPNWGYLYGVRLSPANSCYNVNFILVPKGRNNVPQDALTRNDRTFAGTKGLEAYELTGQVYEGQDIRVHSVRGRNQRNEAVCNEYGPISSAERANALLKEVFMQAALNNVFTCQVLDIAIASCSNEQSEFQLSVVLEKVRTSLALDIAQRKSEGRKFTEKEIVELAGRVSCSLVISYKQSLVHGSLSPASIFLSVDGQWKVGDYGTFAAQKELKGEYSYSLWEKQLRCTSTVSSRRANYQSPEQSALNSPEQEVDNKVACDSYALGVTLLEMASAPGSPSGWENLQYSGFLKNLIGAMLRNDPTSRPFAAAVSNLTTQGEFLVLQIDNTMSFHYGTILPWFVISKPQLAVGRESCNARLADPGAAPSERKHAKLTLAMILSAEQDFSAAAEIMQKMVSEERGTSHYLPCVSILAHLYYRDLLYTQAETTAVTCFNSLRDRSEDVAGILLQLLQLIAFEKRDAVKSEKYTMEVAAWWQQRHGEVNAVTEGVYLRAAVSFLENKQLVEAEKMAVLGKNMRVRRVGDRNPECATCFLRLSQVYLHTNRAQEAEKLAITATRLMQQVKVFDSDVFKVRIAICLRLKKVSEAANLAQQQIDLHARLLGERNVIMVNIYLELANTYASEGQNSEAEEYCQRAQQLVEDLQGPFTKDSAQVYHLLVNFYAKMGNVEKAEAALEKFLGAADQLEGSKDLAMALSLGVVCGLCAPPKAQEYTLRRNAVVATFTPRQKREYERTWKEITQDIPKLASRRRGSMATVAFAYNHGSGTGNTSLARNTAKCEFKSGLIKKNADLDLEADEGLY